MKCSTQAQSIHQLSEVYAAANVEIEQLKEKVCSYMESATIYKSENEDLRARCSELEEMLRQEESKLETETNKHEDAEKETIQAKEKLQLCFDSLNDVIKERDSLNEQLESQVKVSSMWREKYLKEMSKSLWHKFKERWKRQ